MMGPTDGMDDETGRKYCWLVKWDGYPISQATWESLDSMSDPEFLIAAFSKAAEEEGLDLESPRVLLAEAVKGGWL